MEEGIEFVAIPASLVGGPTGNEPVPAVEQELLQVYPNPFSTQLTLEFSITEFARVKLEIYDLQGRVVTMLADARYTPGTHTLSWDVSGNSQSRLADGIYLARMEVISGSSSVVRSSQIQLMR